MVYPRKLICGEVVILKSPDLVIEKPGLSSLTALEPNTWVNEAKN